MFSVDDSTDGPTTVGDDGGFLREINTVDVLLPTTLLGLHGILLASCSMYWESLTHRSADPLGNRDYDLRSPPAITRQQLATKSFLKRRV